VEHQRLTPSQVTDALAWRMPRGGILGGACYSRDYVGMTLEQIEAPEDGDEDDEFGTDLVCEWYRLCQTRGVHRAAQKRHSSWRSSCRPKLATRKRRRACQHGVQIDLPPLGSVAVDWVEYPST
jgi:hypothetical protein